MGAGMNHTTNCAPGFETMKAEYLTWATCEIQLLMERQAELDIDSPESSRLASRIGLLLLKVGNPGLYPYSFT